MELIDVNKEDKIISQHNTITSGRYDYSACMMDILFMILASLEKDKDTYIISVKDIEMITGRTWQYNQLKKSTEIMGSRMFEIENEHSYKQIWLFSSIEYLKGTGTFEVSLNPKAKHLFFELKNNFTAMNLKSVLSCTSKYAKRLYGIACQWRSVGTKRFEILELKKMLGLVDKEGHEQFERISDFKKFVLDIAVKQINENTDINFSYELRKRGRNYHWVTFFFENQMFKQLEIDFNQSIDVQKYIRKIEVYGLNEEQAKIIASKMTEKQFDEVITEVNTRIRQGLKINNTSAYLVGVMQKKGILPIVAK